MKHFISAAACLALSLGLCSNAMAKDVDAIDVFDGNDFIGVVSVDYNKLVSNKMISDTMSQAGIKMDDISAPMLDFGIDYKKDIKSVSAAVNANSDYCVIIDTKVSLAKVKEEAAKGAASIADYKGFAIITDTKGETIAFLSDTRYLSCASGLDIKPSIDNSVKNKSLKSRDKAIYDAYAKTSSKADIRIGAKLNDAVKAQVGRYGLKSKSGDAIIGIKDAEAISLSVDFNKGLAVDASILGKDDKVASSAAAIINENIAPYINAPELADMGIGFVKDCVKVSAAKKYVNGSVKFNDDQMASLIALVVALTASAPQQQ